MVFAACGLNHKTAPLELREKVALPLAHHECLLHNLLAQPTIQEAAILSTCNRTEIYCDTEDPERLTGWLAEHHALSLNSLSPFVYLHQGQQGIKHALRVASGLDSMMVGEPQILGQMKEAYQRARELGSVKSQLRPVFEYVFRASKRIRSHSGIGVNPVSVAYAAAQWVGQLCGNRYENLRVYIIGSGETSALVAKYLKQQGVQHFMVSSRSQAHAEALAHSLAGTTIAITELSHYLPKADVVISATTCPLPFITKNLVEQSIKDRADPLYLLDLALPRDIEPSVKDLPGVHLYNLDDLNEVVTEGLSQRRSAALHAEDLIEQEMDNFLRLDRSFKAKALICDYRDTMHKLAAEEVQRAIKKMAQGADEHSVLHEFGKRLVNKLTHTPTKGLKHLAMDGQEELLHLAQYLFNTTLPKKSYEEIA